MSKGPTAPLLRTLGLGGLAVASAGMATLGLLFRQVNTIQRFPAAKLEGLRAGRRNPLFDAFPGLANRIPWRPLGAYPTPVEEYPLSEAGGGARLFVKRDDLSSPQYGGNKVRKLEFLLAEAELSGRRSLITLGGIGSNHALATAVHGLALGFHVDLILYDQPITPVVRKNLGGFLAAGATLHHRRSIASAFLFAGGLYVRRRREARTPYFIMVGGTSRLGCLGHVAAALELSNQIAAGELPEPDFVLVPLGTAGTAAGLIVGLRLAGVRSRVLAVRVADPIAANAFVVRHFAQDVADFLHTADPAVPRLHIARDDFDVVTEYIGEGYGHPTAAAESAVSQARSRLSLETTYTGKTLAACLDHCRSAGRQCTFLFWNSFSSTPVPEPEGWDHLPPSLKHVVSATAI